MGRMSSVKTFKTNSLSSDAFVVIRNWLLEIDIIQLKDEYNRVKILKP